MSLTWPLLIDVHNPARGSIKFEEDHTSVDVEINYWGTSFTSLQLTEDAARDLHDWLGWFLGERDEPQELRTASGGAA